MAAVVANHFSFLLVPAAAIVEADLIDMAGLFSDDYAVWGVDAPAPLVPGQRVQCSPGRLPCDYLQNDACSACIVRQSGRIVAHALFCRFRSSVLNGDVVWITQLVVRCDMRHARVTSRAIAIGLVASDVTIAIASSHPYAIRALERVAHHRAVPCRDADYVQRVFADLPIQYLSQATLRDNGSSIIINTSFFVDHDEISRIILQMGDAWSLGTINEGEEFIAVLDVYKDLD